MTSPVFGPESAVLRCAFCLAPATYVYRNERRIAQGLDVEIKVRDAIREQTDYVSASAVSISAMACDDHVAGLRAALYDRYGTYQCNAIGDSPVSPTSYPNDTSLMDTVNKLLDADSYLQAK